MLEIISSRLTPVVKFVFPTVWLVLGGGVIATMWIGGLLDRQGAPPPEFVRSVATAAWLFGLVIGLRESSRLKRVRMDETNLYVSDYRYEAAIPFTSVEKVQQFRWLSNRPVVLRLKAPCAFGDEIYFVPRGRPLAFWQEDSIVAELRRRAGLAL